MIFLSQLVKKPIYLDGKKFATVVDFGLPSKLQSPSVSTILLKKGKEKFAVDKQDFVYTEGKFQLSSKDVKTIAYNPDDFYLAEDLLDKQVIDITGKRMVRVNDVLLKVNGELKVNGIDISFSGILRRLGLSSVNPLRAVTIPWSAVEAFDYETGDVRIKLGKNNLSTLHPAEIADILEEAGTKEREGIVEALSAETAADAIEEANDETQEAIFEQLSQPQLKKILAEMPLSEIADVIDEVNQKTLKRVLRLLGTDKAKKVQRLMVFPDDVAGGLMEDTFYKTTEHRTMGEVLGELSKLQVQPEGIIVVDKDQKLIGQVQANELINASPSLPIQQLITEPFSVREDDSFTDIFQKFAHYNLRILPVVNSDNHVMGVISIDAVLRRIEEEEEEKDETF